MKGGGEELPLLNESLINAGESFQLAMKGVWTREGISITRLQQQQQQPRARLRIIRQGCIHLARVHQPREARVQLERRYMYY